MMNEFSQYTERRIPWEEGAQGPDAYYCGSFVTMIQRVHFGLIIENVLIPDYEDTPQLVEIMKNHPDLPSWPRVKTQQHGDIVLVHRPLHYGVWIDIDGGGVLHCVRGSGVVYTKGASWQFSGFGRREYFRHVSKI